MSGTEQGAEQQDESQVLCFNLMIPQILLQKIDSETTVSPHSIEHVSL